MRIAQLGFTVSLTAIEAHQAGLWDELDREMEMMRLAQSEVVVGPVAEDDLPW